MQGFLHFIIYISIRVFWVCKRDIEKIIVKKRIFSFEKGTKNSSNRVFVQNHKKTEKPRENLGIFV